MTVELRIVRDKFQDEANGVEGFTLGRLFHGDEFVCYTLEDQDRHLEDGNGKIYGKSAMPTGRYELQVYPSPRHGLVPLFIGVPGFKMTEIHKANHASELLGCVAVGQERSPDGVYVCAPALADVVRIMQKAKQNGEPVFCTIERE